VSKPRFFTFISIKPAAHRLMPREETGRGVCHCPATVASFSVCKSESQTLAHTTQMI